MNNHVYAAYNFSIRMYSKIMQNKFRLDGMKTSYGGDKRRIEYMIVIMINDIINKHNSFAIIDYLRSKLNEIRQKPTKRKIQAMESFMFYFKGIEYHLWGDVLFYDVMKNECWTLIKQNPVKKKIVEKVNLFKPYKLLKITDID